MVERPSGRAEIVVDRVLHQGVRELEVADTPLADERGSGRRLEMVEDLALVELERRCDHGGVEFPAGDRRHSEHALCFWVEPTDTRVQHCAHGPRHLDAGEVDLGVPSSLGVRREHARLDEMTQELDHEQRVPVRLLLQVRRHRATLVTQLVTGGRLDEGGQGVGAQALDEEISDRRQGS